MCISDRDQGLRNSLIAEVTDELRKSARLISVLDDAVFASAGRSRGSIGGHIRHILEFVQCLLDGFDKGLVDYSARKRDAEIESDRRAALTAISVLSIRLLSLDAFELDSMVRIRSENADGVWLCSSLGRELEYLKSHAVHHHALVKERLDASGIRVDDGFGVAASTQRYWNAADTAAENLARI